MLELDHLAVAARTLEEGRAAVEGALGVRLQGGGRHPHFATHNLLLGLEDGLYLEVIAIDPDAPPPDYARWFDLDRFDGSPRLNTWICRSDDLTGEVVRFPQAGQPVALSRGDLNWRMAVPDDGILPYDNLFPALIQWDCAAHPAERLTASGCSLLRLVVSHPQAGELADLLGPVLREDRVQFERGVPGLRAEIATPGGMRVLE
ncbi:VOC family protein [Roseovarius sp. PS-C2]|uniref:VOC family protein n=1 Tax=Roseovarius sp. PS-C2 TaxID=2820814 RepID=UPI001C0B9B7B|nr:VOC family protein [Roseovarius sp. PS-C2]MBU3258617.1 VOC family protein [Roseovarius sp. PS-C2]